MTIRPIHHGLSGDILFRFRMAKPTQTDVSDLLTHLENSSTPSPIVGQNYQLERLLRDITPAQITSLELGTSPTVSLRSYYRLFLRDLGLDYAGLNAVLTYLYRHPTVAYAYPELLVNPASLVWCDPSFAPDQAHLDGLPQGPGVRDYWLKDLAGTTTAGRGTRLYAVEHGWETRHGDLVGRRIGAPIHGDNAVDLPVKDITALQRINHGTSALAVTVGTDDNPGRIGVAPAVESVVLSSCYERARNIGEHVASAIVAATKHHVANPGVAGVLMLQVQRGRSLPVEVEEADFLAIRLAVAKGLAVIEPAGNGNLDLSATAWPDSGALVVGAHDAFGDPLHHTNQGQRVDIWALGEGVRTAGAPLVNGVPDRSAGPLAAQRRDDFGRTSAASAILAGVALCLLGRAQQRGVQNAGGLDLRGWMRGPHHHPGAHVSPLEMVLIEDNQLVAGAAALPKLDTRAPSYPWQRGVHVLTGALQGLTTSNPEFGEGNTDVVQRDPAYPNGNPDAVVGFVRVPPLSGQNMPHATPGASPITSGQNDPPWVEHWVLTKGSVLTAPPDVMVVRYDEGDSSSNPNGEIWGQGVIDYFKNRSDYDSDWRYAEVSTHYKNVPPAPNPPVSDSGCTLRHYILHKNHEGTWVQVGELRRVIKSSTQVVDHWMMWNNYLFADEGKDVRLTRATGAESTSTQSWLAAMYTASQGSTPRPTWYAKASYNLVAF